MHGRNKLCYDLHFFKHIEMVCCAKHMRMTAKGTAPKLMSNFPPEDFFHQKFNCLLPPGVTAAPAKSKPTHQHPKFIYFLACGPYATTVAIRTHLTTAATFAQCDYSLQLAEQLVHPGALVCGQGLQAARKVVASCMLSV